MKKMIDDSFLSLVFINIAKTTPVWANEAPKMLVNIVSYPNVIILLMAKGIIPQCNPNITNTCQNAPKKIPATIGLKAISDTVPIPTNLLAQVVNGPITIYVAGTTINNVKNGTKKTLTTLGITLVKNFSIFELNNTANIIGITVEL